MNKIELVQTHKLLKHISDEYDLPTDELNETAPNLKPEDIHRSKGDHKDAIWALFEDLEREFEKRCDSTPDATPTVA